MKKTVSLIIALALLTACASTRDAGDETAAETAEGITGETTSAEETSSYEETAEETTAFEETAVPEPKSELPPDVGNSCGNIVNGGFAAIKDGWIYYNGNDGCFYKMHDDCSEKTKLADHKASYINVVDGWVYYEYASDDGFYIDEDGFIHTEKYGIFKMRTDGSEETLLIDEWLANCVTASDGWLYYQYDCDRMLPKDGGEGFDYIRDEENSGIFKIRLDGSERTQVTSGDISEMNVVGDWIYYYGDDLYKVRTDGTEKTSVLPQACCYWINVVGDWIYYRDDDIYKVRTDGTENKFVSNKIYNNINVADSWIYCDYWYEEGNSHPIYRMRLDGSEATRLCDESVGGINIVGDWIIYDVYGYDYSKYYYIMRLDGSEHRLLD